MSALGIRDGGDWRPPCGARVVIKMPHPWGGHAGVVVRHEGCEGRPAIVVEIDGWAGATAGVVRRDEIEVVELPPDGAGPEAA